MWAELQSWFAKVILAVLVVLFLVAAYFGYSVELPDYIKYRDARLWDGFPTGVGTMVLIFLWGAWKLERDRSGDLLSVLVNDDVKKFYRRLLPAWKKKIHISVICSFYSMICWFLIGALLRYWSMYYEYILDADSEYGVWGGFIMMGAPIVFIVRAASNVDKMIRRAIREGALGAEEEIEEEITDMKLVYGRKQRGGKSSRRRELKRKHRQRNNTSNDRHDSI